MISPFLARSQSLAARLTTDPMAVYSKRPREPFFPSVADPKEMPIPNPSLPSVPLDCRMTLDMRVGYADDGAKRVQ